jgi:hypothetical protein
MQRPKWLSGWGEGKNLFEGALLIDSPDVRVVEASFNKKLLFFALGTLEKRETIVSRERSTEDYETKARTDFQWKIFYDSTILPKFITYEKAMNFMAGIVAVSSGEASVHNAGTVFIPTGSRPSKGNAPVLLDYELAKKIEEAKRQKMKEI